MKKHLVLLAFLSFLPFVTGCGGGESPAPAPSSQTAAQPTAAEAEADELGKHLLMLVDTMPPSAAFALDNLRLAAKMYPEKVAPALLRAIEKQHANWLNAFKLLPALLEPEIPGLKDLMLKVWRQEGYQLGKTEAAAILAHIKCFEIADEVLKYLKDKGNLAYTSDYVNCAPMLKNAKPAGTEEFVISLLESKPLPDTEKLAVVAEVFGAVAPEKAVPILDKLLYNEDLNEQAYVGIVRGLGAAGSASAKTVLFKFSQFLQEISEQNQLLKVRKYGRSMIAAQGELARFAGEDVWEYFLLHEASAYNGFEADYDRVASLVAAIPAEFKEKIAQNWAYPPWANDKRHKPTYLEAKKQTKGEVMLGLKFDENFKQQQLALVKKFRQNPMFDGNLTQHLKNLGRYAVNGDQAIQALFREIAAGSGAERFTSRSYARQILAEMKDEYLLECLLNQDFYGEMSDWGRVLEWEAKLLPGLSDKFLKKEHKSIHEKGQGLSVVVFKYLAKEARDDVLQLIESEIMKTLPDPRRTLVFTWLDGLFYWPGDAPEKICRAIIEFYAKEGFTHESSAMGALDGEKKSVLMAAWHELAKRGDREAFSIFYQRKPALYLFPWEGIPETFKAFISKDYGPVTWFWPTLEEVLADKK